MNGSEEFKAGEEKGAVSAQLIALVKALDEFKQGIGTRIGQLEEKATNNRTDIEVLKDNVSDIKGMFKWLFTAMGGLILIQLGRLIFKV